MHYWLNPDSDILEHLLPGAVGAGLNALWILSEEMFFPPQFLKTVVNAVPERRCAIWQVAAEKSSTPDCGKYRAFANYPDLVNTFLVRNEMLYSEKIKSLEFRNTLKCFADIGWLENNQWDQFSKFASQSRFGIDSTIAFLPDDPKLAQYWGHIMLGQFWLAMNFNYGEYSSLPYIPSRQVAVSIIRMALSKGIICTSVFQDSDMRRALVVWGMKEELIEMCKSLSDTGIESDKAEFQRWCSRGIDIHI